MCSSLTDKSCCGFVGTGDMYNLGDERPDEEVA
jgi:hypothetical protein